MIYSVMYEEADSRVGPFVYVIDCGTVWGTKLEEHYMGPGQRKKLSSSSGYLLSQGDTIRLDPYWVFHIHLLDLQHTGSPRSKLQWSEVKARP